MLRLVASLIAATLMIAPKVGAAGGDAPPPAARWQTPPPEVMKVLHAPQLPRVWTAPTGKHLLLADPVVYPPLAELAAPLHELAGMRVNPITNDFHGRHGATSPRLVAVEGGTELRLPLPADAELYDVIWTADGRRFALTIRHPDHIAAWVGSIDGDLRKIENLAVNQLLGTGVSWLPDQRRLLVRRIPERGPAPQAPAIPAGPEILEGAGEHPAPPTRPAICSRPPTTMPCSGTTQPPSWWWWTRRPARSRSSVSPLCTAWPTPRRMGASCS